MPRGLVRFNGRVCEEFQPPTSARASAAKAVDR
jgi:hypothetical protein